jgi:hypothetical protein
MSTMTIERFPPARHGAIAMPVLLFLGEQSTMA